MSKARLWQLSFWLHSLKDRNAWRYPFTGKQEGDACDPFLCHSAFFCTRDPQKMGSLQKGEKRRVTETPGTRLGQLLHIDKNTHQTARKPHPATRSQVAPRAAQRAPRRWSWASGVLEPTPVLGFCQWKREAPEPKVASIWSTPANPIECSCAGFP